MSGKKKLGKDGLERSAVSHGCSVGLDRMFGLEQTGNGEPFEGYNAAEGMSQVDDVELMEQELQTG